MQSGKGGREVVDKDWNFFRILYFYHITKEGDFPVLSSCVTSSWVKIWGRCLWADAYAISATKAGRASSSFRHREAGLKILEILKL